jgi:hypothetical protein
MNTTEIERMLGIPSLPLDDAQRHINRTAFIRLWTLCSGSSRYDKADWMSIERQLQSADLI